MYVLESVLLDTFSFFVCHGNSGTVRGEPILKRDIIRNIKEDLASRKVLQREFDQLLADRCVCVWVFVTWFMSVVSYGPCVDSFSAVKSYTRS